MALDIVLKFTDNLLLSEEALSSLFIIPKGYGDMSAEYARTLTLKTVTCEASSVWRQLTALLEKVDLKPAYLFLGADVELPLTLLRRARAMQNTLKVAAKEPPLPTTNPYNYFRLRLPDSYPAQDIASLLGELRYFLPKPTKPDPKISKRQSGWQTSLLAEVYIKGNPVPTAYDWPEHAQAYATQDYFDRMQIARDHTGRGTGITLLEAHGWDLDHAQFANRQSIRVGHPNTLQLDTTRFSLDRPGTYANYAKHGNKVLGVLWARTDNENPLRSRADLCRGIVPDATVRLVSCLSAVTLSQRSDSTFADKTYDEESALQIAIADCQPGDVLLIQLAYGGGGYPLSIAPAISYQVMLAERLGITVILAAGNMGVSIPEPTDNSQDAQLFEASVLDLLTNPVADPYSPGLKRSAITGRTPAEQIRELRQFGPAGLLVGAIPKEAGSAQPNPLRTSTRGYGVRAFAQGEGILTTGVNNQYDSMGSTSGAASIVAGMVTALQGIAKLQEKYIPPAQVRVLLTFGTAVNGGGWQPNYAQAHTQLMAMMPSLPAVPRAS
jgi:hypothetical protein